MPMMMQSSLLNDSLQKVIYNLYRLRQCQNSISPNGLSYFSFNVSTGNLMKDEENISGMIISPYFSALETGSVQMSI